MFVLKNLISNEFFPKELPPCFSTSSITKLSTDELNTLGIVDYSKIKETTPIIFSGYKSESSRRRFAVPNFMSYIRLAKLITDNSERIFKTFDGSQNSSLTAPTKKIPLSSEPYHKPVQSFHESGIEVEKLYYNHRFELYLDISSFFDNIYTHTIAWAIEGKSIAKANHDNTLLGNQLDTLVRSLNRNQTNGILIGNALSRIISEIILCRVDEQIHSQLPKVKYKRFVDDYYIFTENGYDIPNILSVFRTQLAAYELSINENKMQIMESPFVFGKTWVESIREYIHLDPLIFFNHIIIEYKKYKDVSLLRYGLKIISLYDYSKEAWKTMESKILNLLVSFPSLADIILNILLRNKEKLSKLALKNTVYCILNDAINLSFDQEVIWMAWYIKVLNVNISKACVKKILDTNNTLAAIIILDYIQNYHTMIYKSDLVLKWRKEMLNKMEELKDTVMNSDLWLLAYEGTRHKWFNIGDKQFKKLNCDSQFRYLLDKDVVFYDDSFEYILDKPSQRPIYITRDEVIAKFNELKKQICSCKIDSTGFPSSLNVEFEKFEHIVALNEY